MTYRQKTRQRKTHTRAKTLRDETFHSHTDSGTQIPVTVAHACMRLSLAMSWEVDLVCVSHAHVCVRTYVPHRISELG